MDWFERLTGFREDGYEATQARLDVTGHSLRSRVNGRSYEIGEFELVSLDSLRTRVRKGAAPSGKLKVRNTVGDVRALHRDPRYAGALFQVASQFNMLEMISPDETPEQGVGRYEYDRTQGPACAVAAGAATIFRNYFVPVGGARGQTQVRQLDGLSDVGIALAQSIGVPVSELWRMSNGYALCTRTGLSAIGAHLSRLSAADLDAMREKLRIGLHVDVEVTDGGSDPGPLVSQAFCSALPVSYTAIESELWQPLAQLILEATYEATLWAAVLNAQRGASNIVLLTRVGGGAFGNDDAWIDAAMTRALTLASDFELDVRIVSFSAPPRSMLEMEARFA
jgi:hypothetical protein